MRLANIANRLTLVTANGEIIDISKETGGSFSPGIQGTRKVFAQQL